MNQISILILLLAACLGSPGTILAVTAANDISVEDPYVLSIPGQSDSPVYLVLVNRSAQGRGLVQAESLMSRILELRAGNPASGTSGARRLAKIDISGKGQTRLEPGGLHIMLIGLKRVLVPGTNITVTLVFGDGSRKDVRVPVREPERKPEPPPQHGDMMKTHEQQMRQHDNMMK